MNTNIFIGKNPQEAKALYYSISKEQHPDRGGNLLLMQAVNAMWEEYNNPPQKVGKVAKLSINSNSSNSELIEQILDATGLNWRVVKDRVLSGSGIEFTDKSAIIREDNNYPLAIMGDGYEILQNRELTSIVYDAGKEVFNESAKFSHPWNNSETLGSVGNIGGGSLKDGRKVFLQLELPNAYIGKSDVKRYITITNSHDGSSSVGFGTSSQVICCQNTFNIANKMLSKFKHTASLQQRLDESMHLLRKVLKFEDEQIGLFEKAASESVTNKAILDIRSAVFPDVKDFKDKSMSTRQLNQILALESSIKKSFNEQGETMWGLFNGVTKYTNHCLNMEDITYKLMFGTAAGINKRAYDYIYMN